jgi:imidazolonepropionase-like amidohydrolase
MRQLALPVFFLTVICTAATQQPATLALVNAKVYASPEAVPLENAIVIVRDATIAQVGNSSSLAIPTGATVVDVRGAIVTAGFQNSHVHFSEQKWAGAAEQSAQKLSDQLEAMLTRYGFTTVVDTGSFLPDTVALRRRIESGEIGGPRILSAGVPLYPPNGIPYYVRDGLPPALLKLLHQPATDTQAVGAVRQNIDGGADVVKLFTGSWVTNQRVLPMPDDVARAAVAEAHRQGKLVYSHASSVAGLEVALNARVDVIAHALDDTRGLTENHFRKMSEQNVALVPTLTLFADSGDATRRIFAEVANYQRLGGRILFGTDVGYHAMYEPTLEYESLAKTGLTWRQVLASLTTNPADRFGESKNRGRVAPGMAADLVVLASDPALDIRAFVEVGQTIRAGRIVYSRP